MKFSNPSWTLTFLVAFFLVTTQTAQAAKKQQHKTLPAPTPTETSAPVAAPEVQAPHPDEGFRQGSEFVFQPTLGTHAIQPALQYTALTRKFKPQAGVASGNTTVKGWSEGLNYDYGWTESLSLGGTLSYSNLESKTDGLAGSTFKSKGLDNVGLRLTGIHPLLNPAVFFRYGVEGSLSFGRRITQPNGDVNNRSGGQTFTPFVGAEWVQGHSLFGARLGYDVIKTNTKTEQKIAGASSTKIDLQGGNKFTGSLFGEMNLEPWLLGAALIFEDIAGFESATIDSAASPPGSQNLFIRLYAPYELTHRVTLLPGIQYGWSPSGTDGGADIEAYHVWQLLFGARLSI